MHYPGISLLLQLKEKSGEKKKTGRPLTEKSSSERALLETRVRWHLLRERRTQEISSRTNGFQTLFSVAGTFVDALSWFLCPVFVWFEVFARVPVFFSFFVFLILPPLLLLLLQRRPYTPISGGGRGRWNFPAVNSLPSEPAETPFSPPSISPFSELRASTSKASQQPSEPNSIVAGCTAGRGTSYFLFSILFLGKRPNTFWRLCFRVPRICV